MKDYVLPALVSAVVTALGALLVGIYGDLLPAAIPALAAVPSVTYVKIVALLLLLLLLVSFLALVLYAKARVYKPRSLRGSAFGYRWSAELDYIRTPGDVEIEMQWVCPRHKVFLGVKSAEIPETTYYRLWCRKCDRFHDMISGGDPVYVQEAERIVKRDILKRVRF